MSMRTCPRDGAQLTPTRFMSLIMDSCPQCDGTWLDKGELGQFLGTQQDLYPAQGLQQDDPRGPARCPCCQTPMISRWFSMDKQVLVDRCPACWGIWLDAQELQQIFKERFNHSLDREVFVTSRGKCYHTESCIRAGKKAYPISMREAGRRGLNRCILCRA